MVDLGDPTKTGRLTPAGAARVETLIDCMNEVNRISGQFEGSPELPHQLRELAAQLYAKANAIRGTNPWP